MCQVVLHSVLTSGLCRFREPEALAKARATYHDDIERFIALQWIFDDQWAALKVRPCSRDCLSDGRANSCKVLGMCARELTPACDSLPPACVLASALDIWFATL